MVVDVVVVCWYFCCSSGVGGDVPKAGVVTARAEVAETGVVAR